ncbi:uncharacterized protein PRD47_003697 [Ara ararauna]
MKTFEKARGRLKPASSTEQRQQEVCFCFSMRLPNLTYFPSPERSKQAEAQPGLLLEKLSLIGKETGRKWSGQQVTSVISCTAQNTHLNSRPQAKCHMPAGNLLVYNSLGDGLPGRVSVLRLGLLLGSAVYAEETFLIEVLSRIANRSSRCLEQRQFFEISSLSV